MFQLFRADEEGVPSDDRGLAYGDGLFETLRVSGDHAPLLNPHLDRLVRDAGRLGIPVPRGDLEKTCLQIMAREAGQYDGRPWVLKLILTRGGSGRGYQPEPGASPHLLVRHGPAPDAPPEGGVDIDFSPVPLTVNPVLAGIKSLNRLEQVMAAKAMPEGIFEVLMSNAEGQVVEGTRTNLFLATDDGWQTPPASTLAVCGVMRRHVLACLHNAGEPVVEAPVTLDQLGPDRCRGLYLTNSVLGVVPVRTLAGQALPVTRRLATIAFSSQVME
ncbi:aminodeoxychorismate lyase [Marinobacter oulmenensis]|uniref:Aminodeoxychorismate lyase n=1 Tax=Marinobacter oulmenensis TaxID=643747 RepID=A0A840UP26_9GAMM|nr:4-amino-4-deoxychorismate lyase [Marinobacter oulmenensis]